MLCTKLTNVIITNVSEITTEFAIETFKHFNKANSLTIQHVERYLESKVEAKEQSISVQLFEAELGRIIDYLKNHYDESIIYNNKYILIALTLLFFFFFKRTRPTNFHDLTPYAVFCF